MIKIRSLKNPEYTASDLLVYKRVGRELQSVAVSSKGCFAADESSAYLVTARDNLGSIVPAGERPEELMLHDIQDSEINLDCPTAAVPSNFSFETQLHNAGPLDGFILDMKMSKDGAPVGNLRQPILSRDDYRFSPLAQQSDGRLSLDISIQNLLKQMKPRQFHCDVQIDNTPPAVFVTDSLGDKRENHLGFSLIDPAEKLQIAAADASQTKLLYCWQKVVENTLEADPAASCEFGPVKSDIAVPEPGYWILHYKGVDEAGQFSPSYQQRYLVYEQAAIKNLQLEMELADFLMDKSENFKALEKSVLAETRRRKFATDFARSQNREAVYRNLIRSSLQRVPYSVRAFEAIRGIALTPDGKGALLDLSYQDSRMAAIETATGKTLWEAEHPNGSPERMQFSPDGRQILSSGSLSGDILIWNFADGQLLRTLKREAREGISNKVFELALAGDGRFLGAPGYDDSLYIYDLERADDQPLVKLSYPKSLVSFAWSPSGERFITAEGQNIHVYARDGRLIESMVFPSGLYVSSAAFLSENEWIVAVIEHRDGAQRKLYKSALFYGKQGLSPMRAAAIDGNVDKVLPSPDFRHLVAFGIGSNGARIFRNWRTQWEHAPQPGAARLAFSVLDGGKDTDGFYWASDSRSYVTTSWEGPNDSHVRAYAIDGAEILKLGPKNRAAALAADGKTLLHYETGGVLEFWRLDQTPLEHLRLPDPVQVLKYSPDARYLLTIEGGAARQSQLKVWDRESRQLVLSLDSDMQYLNTGKSARFVGSRKLLFAKDQHNLVLRELESGEESLLYSQSEAETQSLGQLIVFDLSADEKRLALGYSNGFVAVQERGQSDKLFVAEIHEKSPFTLNADFFNKATIALKFIGQSYDLVSAGQDGKVALHRVTDASRTHYQSSTELQMPETILDLAATEDSLAIAARFNSIVLYSLKDQSYRLFTIDDVSPKSIAISANGSRLAATTASGQLYVWNLLAGDSIGQVPLSPVPSDALELAVSPDGAEIVTAIGHDIVFIPASVDTVYQKLCGFLASYQEASGRNICFGEP